jgi:hydroxymethylcytosylglucuronate/cytosylglucuronate synthase
VRDIASPPTIIPVSGPTIAISGVSFGWGSAGKLSAVIAALRRRLPELHLVGIGTELGRPVLAGLGVRDWYEGPLDDVLLPAFLHEQVVSCALVILDPDTADALSAVGCPTVFVDSLPFLWTSSDPIPSEVAVYCAQICSNLPPPSWEPISRISNLSWVEAIVPPRPHRVDARSSRRAVVNFGGLHSPQNPAGNPTYLRYLLAPTIDALICRNYSEIAICGNIGEAELPPIGAAGVRITSGRYQHESFLALVEQAGILVTSPGLTTLLEGSSMCTPTVCLPPQNISQVFNSERFAQVVSPYCRVSWPRQVLDLAALHQVRLDGEAAALAAMSDALGSRSPEAWHAEFTERIVAAIDATRHVPSWSALTDQAGVDGADQVADAVVETVAGTRGAPMAGPGQRARSPRLRLAEHGHALGR